METQPHILVYLFQGTTTKLSLQNLQGLQNLKYLPSGPLKKKFANLDYITNIMLHVNYTLVTNVSKLKINK